MIKFRVYVDSNGEYLYDNRFPDGDTIFIDPTTDMLGNPEVGWTMALDDLVELEIPGRDGSTWVTTGKIVSVDSEDTFFSLSVTVNWFGAAQVE